MPPFRTQGRVDAGRREIGGRIQNYHVPSADREGDVIASTIVISAVILPFPAVSLSVGSTAQATAIVSDANGNVLTGVAVQWITSTPTVATISGAGLVTGVGAGTAVITATNGSVTSNLLTLTVEAVVVDTTPASIVVTPSLFSFSGGTRQLQGIVKNANGDALDVSPTSWTSSDHAVVTVDANGLVTYVGVGSANVIAHYNAIASNTVVATATTPGVAALIDGLVAGDLDGGQRDFYWGPRPASATASPCVLSVTLGHTMVDVAAFTYVISNVTRSYAGGTVALNGATVPGSGGGANVWAIYSFFINTSGVITCTPGSGNGTPYALEVDAWNARLTAVAGQAFVGWIILVPGASSFTPGVTPLGSLGVFPVPFCEGARKVAELTFPTPAALIGHVSGSTVAMETMLGGYVYVDGVPTWARTRSFDDRVRYDSSVGVTADSPDIVANSGTWTTGQLITDGGTTAHEADSTLTFTGTIAVTTP